MKDKVAKGRSSSGLSHSAIMLEVMRRGGGKKRPEIVPRGDDHYRAVVTEGDVIQIRSLYNSGRFNQTQLGAMFGMSVRGIGAIVHRETWKHIKQREEELV